MSGDPGKAVSALTDFGLLLALALGEADNLDVIVGANGRLFVSD